MTRGVRIAVSLAWLVAACAGLAGCGLPNGGTAERIDDAKVPYNLIDRGPVDGSANTPRVHASATEPKVYWVTKTTLAAAGTDQRCAGDTYTVVQELLHTLASGPSGGERSMGLSTALTPDSRLALLELSGRTAVIEVKPSTPPPADRLPLAVGQVVLTVTSAPGVDQVLLRDKGHRLQIPLPGGALTNSPVSAQDYTSLIRTKNRKHSDAGCEPSRK